jgi:carboxylesterase type B
MPAAMGLFHRAIVKSGLFLKSLSPDYSRRLAELLRAELSLSRPQVQERQEIFVDRLSSAAAEAMRKNASTEIISSSSIW